MSHFGRGGDPYRSSTGNLEVSERWDSERFGREHAGRQRGVRGREPIVRAREPLASGRQSLTTLEIDRGRDRDRIGVTRQRRQSLHFEDEASSFGGGSSRGSPPRSVATTMPWGGSRGRRQSLAFERTYAPPPSEIPRRPRPRPQSHASFERRPYDYEEHIEYRAPSNVPIPLPRIRRSPPRRQREFEERDYEGIRVSEPDRYGDREFREVRERDRHVRRRSKSNSRYSVRSSSSSFGEDFEFEQEYPRKGRTRMPRHLVSRRAVVDLGYPYEEEGDTIIILRALGRRHIDEVIEISEQLRKTRPQPAYRGEERTRVVRAIESAPVRKETIETRTEYIPPPPPSGVEIVREERIISPHREHRAGVIEVGESDGHVGGPLSLFLPDRRKEERSIKAEIRALEAEKKALRLEREVEHENRHADHLRGETIIIEGRDGKRIGDVIIKKNKKGRLEMVR
ncbi:hypothetical protein FGG08_001581 [Glutinoglossum americanum]|uniref:DUF8035 domain-containing protein n=1 Tax=Glutinoglossum americanum TaxID=1670608 RepID=A0A9P8L058_9PEZI|nr:hypothetical protein FGG08_001581 [Glutinoglossum americanum]